VKIMGANDGNVPAFLCPGAGLLLQAPTMSPALPLGELERDSLRFMLGGNVVKSLPLRGGGFSDLSRAEKPDQMRRKDANLEDAAKMIMV